MLLLLARHGDDLSPMTVTLHLISAVMGVRIRMRMVVIGISIWRRSLWIAIGRIIIERFLVHQQLVRVAKQERVLALFFLGSIAILIVVIVFFPLDPERHRGLGILEVFPVDVPRECDPAAELFLAPRAIVRPFA